MRQHRWAVLGILLLMVMPLVPGGLTPLVGASSHREAPLIANDPAADNTDFYMFRSPEDMTTGQKTVTFLANYIPLQAPSGGPNFHHPADDVLYSIKIDNDGDAEPDLDLPVPLQPPSRWASAAARPATPISTMPGPINALDDPNLLVRTYYTVTRVVVDGRGGVAGGRHPRHA